MPTQLPGKPTLAFDTNMLLAINSLKVDVFSETKRMFGEKAILVVPKQVFEELNSLAEPGKGHGNGVGIARQEIERHRIKVVEVDASNADDALTKMAQQGFFVVTNDAKLRKRIKGFGGKVIYLRQKRLLEIG